MEPGVQMVIYPQQNFTKNQKIAFLFTDANRNMPKMKDLTNENEIFKYLWILYFH